MSCGKEALALCHIDDIPEGGSRGFELAGTKVIALRKYGRAYLYLNRCPHLGIPLEWEDDRFLDEEGAYIRCANHGALFLRESGECIQGPCIGEYLWEIDYRLEQGRILIEEEELPGAAPAE